MCVCVCKDLILAEALQCLWYKRWQWVETQTRQSPVMGVRLWQRTDSIPAIPAVPVMLRMRPKNQKWRRDVGVFYSYQHEPERVTEVVDIADVKRAMCLAENADVPILFTWRLNQLIDYNNDELDRLRGRAVLNILVYFRVCMLLYVSLNTYLTAVPWHDVPSLAVFGYCSQLDKSHVVLF